MRLAYRRILTGALMAGIVWPLLAAAPTRAATEMDPFVDSQIVVRLNDPSTLASVTQDHGLDSSPLDQMAIQGLFLLSVTDGTSADAKAAELAADSRVSYAEPNFVGMAPERRGMSSWESGDPSQYTSQWAPSAMRLTEAQQVTRGRGVVVAVLDSGVDTSHPALVDHLTPGYDFVDNDANPAEADAGSGVGHGTHVAGLIALAAPEARIMPIRVLDADGAGDVWRLAKALVWATAPDGDTTIGHAADVINLSLSTFSRTHLMTDIINETENAGRGVVLVAAAGNSGGSTKEFPAGEGGSRLLSVGATSPGNSARAPFSNFGSWVSVAAPGERILSTIPGGGYATWSGTSMSAALASGEAALVRSAFPSLNAREVVKRVELSAVRGSGDQPPHLDAAAAVTGGAGASGGGDAGGGQSGVTPADQGAKGGKDDSRGGAGH
jgi:thermitase